MAKHNKAWMHRIEELRSMPYAEYLATPEWQDRRRASLALADGKCQLCGKSDGGVDVHHRTYDRRGCELPSDLTVLCRGCHEKHHGKDGKSSKTIAILPELITPPDGDERGETVLAALMPGSDAFDQVRAWFIAGWLASIIEPRLIMNVAMHTATDNAISGMVLGGIDVPVEQIDAAEDRFFTLACRASEIREEVR